jgi:HK97 family phage prohead protease
MSKADETQVIEREQDERVKLTLNLDSASTKDLGEGVLECVVTTANEDRHGENILSDGIDTQRYMENPVVLYGHDYYGLPIGKTIKLTEQKTKMKARFQLATDILPFAATVYAMVKAGYINAVSIGGIVKKWSEDYRTIEEMEMLEFSIVSIPANPEALITGRSFEKAVGKSITEVKKEYESAVQKYTLDKLKGMDNDEVKDAIKVLKNLIARLEDTANDASLTDEKTITKIVLKEAKAVATQSQQVIKTIKLKSTKEQDNE